MDFASHVSQAWAHVGQAKNALRQIQRDGPEEPPGLRQLAEVKRSIDAAMRHVGQAGLNWPEENEDPWAT